MVLPVQTVPSLLLVCRDLECIALSHSAGWSVPKLSWGERDPPGLCSPIAQRAPAKRSWFGTGHPPTSSVAGHRWQPQGARENKGADLGVVGDCVQSPFALG